MNPTGKSIHGDDLGHRVRHRADEVTWPAENVPRMARAMSSVPDKLSSQPYSVKNFLQDFF